MLVGFPRPEFHRTVAQLIRIVGNGCATCRVGSVKPSSGHFEIAKFRYRPEVDGLRAVAVLAVVLFHGQFGCPGGYIGVDVFFVISGFLITSLIWKELESGSFTFVNFWERRARRIVGAGTRSQRAMRK